MSDSISNTASPTDRTRADELLESRLGLDPSRIDQAVEDLIQDHPELEQAIRARVDALRSFSLLDSGEEDPFPFPKQLGDFELLRPIAAGGMGTVWEANQISLQRRVALKLLLPGMTLSPTRMSMFEREGLAGGRLNHPNVVSVHAVGEYNGIPYIVEELVEGGRSLADLLSDYRDQTKLPKDYFEQVAEMFATLAEAMQAVHDADIVHRDIKPGNFLIAPDGTPKIADFGLAKILDISALSRSGDLVGTYYYMSPELAAGKRVGLDHRSDVFSLGSTLYEALTLNRPFDGDTREQILDRVLFEEPKDPRAIRSQVPRDLAVICLKAMRKKPAHRYDTMRAFADDLRRYLQREPIQAKPRNLAQTAVSWVRRHPVVALQATAAIAILIALGTFWSYKTFKDDVSGVVLGYHEALVLALSDDHEELGVHFSEQEVLSLFHRYKQDTDSRMKRGMMVLLVVPLVSHGLLMESHEAAIAILDVLEQSNYPADEHAIAAVHRVAVRLFIDGHIDESRLLSDRVTRALDQHSESLPRISYNATFLRVQVLRHFHEYFEATKLAEELVQMASKLPSLTNSQLLDAQFCLAELYALIHRNSDAKTLLDEIIEQEKLLESEEQALRIGRAKNKLAQLLKHEGRLDEADRLWAWYEEWPGNIKKSKSTEIEIWDAIANRLEILIETERVREYPEVISHLKDQALKLDPDDKRQYVTRRFEGSVMIARGEYEDAYEALSQLLSDQQEHSNGEYALAKTRFELARAAWRTDRPKQAEEYFSNSIKSLESILGKLNPILQSECYEELAKFYLHRNRRSEAKDAAESAIALLPSEHPRREHLKELLAQIQ